MILNLKIRNLLLIVVLFSTINVFAQHKPFQFGFKGTVNLGWLASDTEDYKNDGVKIGGLWGFVADIFMMENYSFTTGFDVVYLNGRMSFPYSMDSVDGKLDRTYKSRYVQLPVMFTMKTNNIKDKFRIYGQIGYGLGFLLKAKSNDNFTPAQGEKVKEEKNIYDELSFTRSALILGAGVEIPLYESTYLRTGFTFNNCFINIFKEANTNGRNNFIELSVAVIF